VLVFSDTDQVTFQNTDVATVQAGLILPVSNDTIVGGPGDETLNGFGGDDIISGGGGADTINGGDGNDWLFSGDFYAHDTGTEHDVVMGGTGDDWLSVGYGDDADGGDGTDRLDLDLSASPTALDLDFSSFLTGQPLTIFGGTIQNIERIDQLTGTDFADHLTITGGSIDPTSVHALGGDDWLITSGGYSSLFGDSGDDRINIYGGAAAAYGGDGNDTIQVYDGTVAAEGGAGDDNLNGGAGSDEFEGGDGNDTIYGGAGDDTLYGGEGNDTFLYGIGDGSDTIGDFSAGDTVISDYKTAQSITEIGSDVVVIFSGGDQITFQNTDLATVEAGLSVSFPAGLNLTGTRGADTLIGGSGNDTLNGAGGNDTLDGKGGADSMTGGAGNDTFYVDNAGDQVIEAARGGTDTVHTTISYTLAAYVENGILDSSAAIDMTGNSLANVLTGNTGDNFLYGMTGNDTLKGGAGSDILRGGLGTDTLTGGAGADTFQFETGGGNDKVTDFVSGTDKIDLSLLSGVTLTDVKATLSHGNEVISVDANHDGRADFTITLAGVTYVDTGDYIFG
jgi:Ca2+-binding RTX toxin-like protein